MPIEMETQQPALVQIDDWHIPEFIYEAEEELTTGDAAQIRLDSPPSTIPFDSPPRQVPSERVPSGEEVGEAAGSPSAVIEISDSEENHDTRPRRRRRGRPDYAYRDYQDTMEHAISAPPIGKRKREDSDVDFRSKMKRFVKEITEPYEALQRENQRLNHKRQQWEKDKKQLQDQIRYLQRQIHEQKRRNILKCALCHQTFNESWKVLGCGHTLCQDCVEDIKSRGSVFEYPCPYPECKKPIRSCLDFYPNVVEA
uniref:RING-type domain-containing protein n=1 Tax=Talaromyces marneffei PM1 TaxID=1077442 RepID=A0A093VWU9_TALMA